ncbi:50S ribosomal protein L27 [Patescibacteria group bacterium]|nr:50S ribosomal protein L27 [Patescibacteria group bacterium]
MSTSKSAGSSKNIHDSKPKYLGVKLYEGQPAKSGSIIIRQRGTKFIPGKNVRRGNDDTLYAVETGTVKFRNSTKIKYDGNKRDIKIVEVV